MNQPRGQFIEVSTYNQIVLDICVGILDGVKLLVTDSQHAFSTHGGGGRGWGTTLCSCCQGAWEGCVIQTTHIRKQQTDITDIRMNQSRGKFIENLS